MKFTEMFKTLITVFLISFCAIVVMTGCGSKSVYRDSYRPSPVMSEISERRVKKDYSYRKKSERKPKSIKSSAEMDDSLNEPQPPKTSRMIHYNGFLKLRVSKPTSAINKATAIIKSYGGHVEYLRERTVSFKVPVKNFQKAYKKLKTLGDVLKKTISAEDITDAYSNMDLRLRIAEQTRDRFLELLKRTKNEREKIRLIKQIQRLNEQIERFKNKLRLLSSLASFSRISLVVVPRENLVKRAGSNEKAGFKWIHKLSPFTRIVASSSSSVSHNVPEGMVKLKFNSSNYWIAESPNGVTFISYYRRNNPKSDTDYWANAIKSRIESEFSSVKLKRIDKYKILRFTSISEKPYIYLVGLKASGGNIYMFEIYFPNKALEKRYYKSIADSISGKKSKTKKKETK
ncbi:MAG: DUF4349 domain-containing protein [Desulfobacterales bacterium]|nr:DUF4349 domain-containing protein [Desulfobacterales bacterium]MCP4162715.1 DUF4349 domain-containing protein [Deltaproteobacteria bacterium]